MEVNQAIGKQLNGALDFVAGKDTVIRAFLASEATVDPATTKLVVERAGTVVTELQAVTYTKPVSIVEFLCPTRAACGNWQAGLYKFTATVNGVTLATTATIDFKERQPMRILVRPVKANYKGTIVSVTGDKWRRAVEYVRRVYPVAADKITWVIQDELDASAQKFDLETDPGRLALYNLLDGLMPQHCAANKKADGCYELIVGFIQSRPRGFPNGDLQGFTYGPPVSVSVASDEDMEATVAHEIAHIYGIGDTYADGSIRCSVNPAPNGMSGKDWDVRTKTVSCTAGRTQFPEVSATLIPAEARSYEVGGRGDLGVKACYMGSGGKQLDYWVTPDTYKHLFDQLAPVVAPAVPATASKGGQREAPVSQKLVHFSGFINAVSDVRKDPWYTLESTEPAPDSTGPIVLRAVDASGNVLASHALTPQFVVLSNPPVVVEWSPFDGVIRLAPNTAKFQIVSAGVVKYEEAVNPSDPHISGVTPTITGTTLAGVHDIRWHSTPNGSTPLQYLVEYNPDPLHKPLDWMVLDSDLTATSLTDDFNTLPGGHRAKLRVTATDGIRSATAESQEFKVAFKAPEVYIDDVDPTHPAGTDLELNGEAFDVQDDVVADSRLLWRSSISGVLGYGGQIVARALPAGKHVITLSATNSVGLTTVDSVTIDVLAPPPPFGIATACPLNPPTVGVAFSQTLAAIGATGSVTFSLATGSLPAGLTLSSAGLISGTATAAGTAGFTLQATDSSVPAATTTKLCAMTVNAAVVSPTITAACPLPFGVINTHYSTALTATGTGPIVWSLTGGALGSPLSLSPAGVVSGLPHNAGTFSFTVTATNSGGSASKACSLTILHTAPVAPTIATACPLPSATVGTAYSQAFSSANGVAPLAYSLTAGALPAGMVLSAAGVVSGTPTVAGTASFTVQVADSTTPSPLSSGKSCSLTVNPVATAPTIATVCPLPSGTEGVAYSQTLTATGGTAPYSFTVLAGALPRPLTLSAAGVLSGVPFHAGVYPFTLQVAGNNGLVSQKSCSVTIAAH